MKSHSVSIEMSKVSDEKDAKAISVATSTEIKVESVATETYSQIEQKLTAHATALSKAKNKRRKIATSVAGVTPIIFGILMLMPYMLSRSANSAIQADEDACPGIDLINLCHNATLLMMNGTNCSADIITDFCNNIVALSNSTLGIYVLAAFAGVSCIASPLIYRFFANGGPIPDPTLNLSPAEINEISQRETEVKFSGSPTRKEIRKFLKTADANAKRYYLFKKAMETIRWSPNLDSVVGGYLGAPQPRNVKS